MRAPAGTWLSAPAGAVRRRRAGTRRAGGLPGVAGVRSTRPRSSPYSAEPQSELLAGTILSAGGALISAASYVEAAAVIDRIGDPVLSRRLDELLDLLRIELAPFDAEQAAAARAACADFGKVGGHPAGLNFGDCLAYGHANSQRLLFVGNDFTQTDLHPALGHDTGSSTP